MSEKTAKKISIIDTSNPDNPEAFTRDIGAEAQYIDVTRNPINGQIIEKPEQEGVQVDTEKLTDTLINLENNTYNTLKDTSIDDVSELNDSSIPILRSDGVKKKSGINTFIEKIKQFFGIKPSGSTAKFLNEKGEWDIPENTWQQNEAEQEGYVPAPKTSSDTGKNKVWRTDENGAPAWRDYNNLPFYIVISLDANLTSLGDGIWQIKSSLTPKPDGESTVKGGIFWNIKTEVNVPYQIFIPDDSLQVYKRLYKNSTWENWIKLDTNTWRGIQNNLTSDSATDSLAAAQGKALKTLIDGKAATNHTHLYAGSSSAGGAANNALALDGHPASTSATANSIAMRQGSGYLYATYFNQSSSDESMGTSSKFMFTNSDGFLRKGTIASAKTALGLGSAAYNNTSAFAAAGHTHKYAGSASAGGDANNALKLGGYSASTSATANSIAMRQGNGYLYASYFNQSSGMNEGMTTASNFVFSNSDGFLRKGSIASAKTALGLGSAAYTNSTAYAAASHTHSYLPLAGGVITGSISVGNTVWSKEIQASGNVGASNIFSGNDITVGTVGSVYGDIIIYQGNSYNSVALNAGVKLTADRKIKFPNASGTIQVSSGSSRRIKENIKNMSEDKAKKLLDINIVDFDYIGEFYGGLKNQCGVIAEDTLNIIPEAVEITEEYDETKPIDENKNPAPSVDYRKFIPYLIKMVQIQQKEIDELKTKIKGD